VLEIAGDGPVRRGLEDLARQLGLEGAVRFHGFLPAPAVAALLQRCVAILVPAEAEGYGLVVVEAALCGVPAVGARSGGTVDLVEPGVTGLLVEPGDARALSQSMTAVAQDPRAAREMGHRAGERARAATAGPLADRLAALYDELLSSERGGSRLDAPGGAL
jgi:glycosyltransferase involved in cell wall biosynthesis